MRTLYKKGVYTLDFGRGHEVVVDEFTDQFVIHHPVAGGSQVVTDRAGFEEEAILLRRFTHRYMCGTRNVMMVGHSSGVWFGDAPDVGSWAIDLTLVPDEAFVRGVPG